MADTTDTTAAPEAGKADDPTKSEDRAVDTGKASQKADGTADKPLGEGGERALKAERDARKSLESELSSLKKGLASALGVETAKEDDGDALAAIQEQIRDMQRRNTILALANEHRITDKDDLALLESARDEEAMQRLAARIAPTATEERDATSRRPEPDRSQGGRGGGGSPRGKSVAQVMADRADARAAKHPNS